MPDRSILETLYLTYCEKQASDNAAIKDAFQKLHDCVAYLSLQENEKISNIVCQLCTEHERRAYTAGFQDGFRLIVELDANNQG